MRSAGVDHGAQKPSSGVLTLFCVLWGITNGFQQGVIAFDSDWTQLLPSFCKLYIHGLLCEQECRCYVKLISMIINQRS